MIYDNFYIIFIAVSSTISLKHLVLFSWSIILFWKFSVTFNKTLFVNCSLIYIRHTRNQGETLKYARLPFLHQRVLFFTPHHGKKFYVIFGSFILSIIVAKTGLTQIQLTIWSKSLGIKNLAEGYGFILHNIPPCYVIYFYLKFGLYLPDECWAHSLLELVRRGVEVQDLDDLGDLELVTHVANTRHVLLALPRLQQLGGLNIGNIILYFCFEFMNYEGTVKILFIQPEQLKGQDSTT